MFGKTRKILSVILSLSLLYQQSSYAQVLALDMTKFLTTPSAFSAADKFRPAHLRYFSYDTTSNGLKVLLDKGDSKDLSGLKLKDSTQELLRYFLIGVTLPDDLFWVNLRPDAEDNIIDPQLARTNIGKIFLETDLQLKKDTALATSPQTREGKEYWDKLYKKANELFGSDNITIPTLTRPWIVPGEVILREGNGNVYIYKATLKVMLEQDHLKNSSVYQFNDPRMKALNEYSSQLIRELIIPKLTKTINTSKSYAQLRQVYYSLILARWFKVRYSNKQGTYPNLINRSNLTNLTSKENWSKTTYFKDYQTSFKNGEYNLKTPTYTISGQTIRSYFSGGIGMNTTTIGTGASSPAAGFMGGRDILKAASSPATALLGATVRANGDLSELVVSASSSMRGDGNKDIISAQIGSSPVAITVPQAVALFDELGLPGFINRKIGVLGVANRFTIVGLAGTRGGIRLDYGGNPPEGEIVLYNGGDVDSILSKDERMAFARDALGNYFLLMPSVNFNFMIDPDNLIGLLRDAQELLGDSSQKQELARFVERLSPRLPRSFDLLESNKADRRSLSIDVSNATRVEIAQVDINDRLFPKLEIVRNELEQWELRKATGNNADGRIEVKLAGYHWQYYDGSHENSLTPEFDIRYDNEQRVIIITLTDEWSERPNNINVPSIFKINLIPAAFSPLIVTEIREEIERLRAEMTQLKLEEDANKPGNPFFARNKRRIEDEMNSHRRDLGRLLQDLRAEERRARSGASSPAIIEVDGSIRFSSNLDKYIWDIVNIPEAYSSRVLSSVKYSDLLQWKKVADILKKSSYSNKREPAVLKISSISKSQYSSALYLAVTALTDTLHSLKMKRFVLFRRGEKAAIEELIGILSQAQEIIDNSSYSETASSPVRINGDKLLQRLKAMGSLPETVVEKNRTWESAKSDLKSILRGRGFSYDEVEYLFDKNLVRMQRNEFYAKTAEKTELYELVYASSPVVDQQVVDNNALTVSAIVGISSLSTNGGDYFHVTLDRKGIFRGVGRILKSQLSNFEGLFLKWTGKQWEIVNKNDNPVLRLHPNVQGTLDKLNQGAASSPVAVTSDEATIIRVFASPSYAEHLERGDEILSEDLDKYQRYCREAISEVTQRMKESGKTRIEYGEGHNTWDGNEVIKVLSRFASSPVGERMSAEQIKDKLKRLSDDGGLIGIVLVQNGTVKLDIKVSAINNNYVAYQWGADSWTKYETDYTDIEFVGTNAEVEEYLENKSGSSVVEDEILLTRADVAKLVELRLDSTFPDILANRAGIVLILKNLLGTNDSLGSEKIKEAWFRMGEAQRQSFYRCLWGLDGYANYLTNPLSTKTGLGSEPATTSELLRISSILHSLRDIFNFAQGTEGGTGASPVQAVTSSRVGGIDLRTIPMLIQPMGGFANLTFNLPKLSNLESINLDKELKDIKAMVAGGIIPSGDRLKEYIAACYQKKVSRAKLDSLIPELIQICKLQEEDGVEADQSLKQALVLVDVI